MTRLQQAMLVLLLIILNIALFLAFVMSGSFWLVMLMPFGLIALFLLATK